MVFQNIEEIAHVLQTVDSHGVIIGILDRGVPNVACRILEMAMSPVSIYTLFMSILKCSNVSCRI